jgi:hypothetical protein
MNRRHEKASSATNLDAGTMKNVSMRFLLTLKHLFRLASIVI